VTNRTNADLLKEDLTNKSTATTLGTSDVLYPTQNAVKTYVDAQVTSGATPDATTSAKGKIQLAGDLGGTAAAPTVPGLALKAPIASPTFTGTPAAPTAAAGTNTTQVATTAFVATANATNANLTGDVTSVGNATTLSNSGVTAATYGSATSVPVITVDAKGRVTSVTNTNITATAYSGTLPIANGGTGATTLTGLVKGNGTSAMTVATAGTDYLAPNGSAASLTNFPTLNQNTTGTAANITATTNSSLTTLPSLSLPYTQITGAPSLSGYLTSSSGVTTISGGTTGLTPSSATSGAITLGGTLSLANGGTGATTASGALTNLGAAPIDSPSFTGTPTAPTATAGTNTTQVATTAFVTAAIAAGGGSSTYTTGLNSSLGGYVFYVTPDGKHGLVAETYEYQDSYYNAANSLKNPSNHSIAGQNFLDWRLPELYELNLMYNIKTTLGMTTYDYWSGTSHNYAYGSTAFYKQFNNGVQYDVGKDQAKYIRAVRSF
jgi:hypothetical protein